MLLKAFSYALVFSLLTQPVLAEELSVAKRLQRISLKKLEQQKTKRKSVLSGLSGKKITGDQSAIESADGEEAQAGTPDTLADGDISPEVVEIIPHGPLTATTPWKRPDYSGQEKTLGYAKDIFKTPEGLRDRVAFWKSIYARYTTNQGVMHDSLHIGIVYQAVDFGSIMRDSSLNSRQKHHARERLVNSYRKEIEDRLKRLAQVNSPKDLSGEDLRVWKLFESIKDKNKFLEATKKGRVRFQLGQKDRFALGIYYSGRYIHELEEIYRSEGLPIELTRLPFVESSFNIYARSKVGASGIWQFMRRTARPYMMVNNAVDERNDPIESTRSSARLLKSNYMMLRSWPLAITGYNHGPNGIARIVKKTGTNDLVQIINNYSSKRFGFASENFYACFLAALEVEKNADKYFGDVKWSVPLKHAELKLPRATPYAVVKTLFKDDVELAQLYNPHFSHLVRRGQMNMPKSTFIRVPVAMKNLASQYLTGKMQLAAMREEAQKLYRNIPILPDGTPVATISAAPQEPPRVMPEEPAGSQSQAEGVVEPQASSQIEEPSDEPIIYKVVRGDNLERIAKRFRVAIEDIKEANPKIRPNRIRIGQEITIPKIN